MRPVPATNLKEYLLGEDEEQTEAVRRLLRYESALSHSNQHNPPSGNASARKRCPSPVRDGTAPETLEPAPGSATEKG